MNENKNVELLSEFTKYALNHPEERFWQVLRNWSGHNFILFSDKMDSWDMDNIPKEYGITDTFYKEDK